MDQQLGMLADLPENDPAWAIKILDEICAFEKEQNVNINNLRGKLDYLITANAMLEDKLDKALQVAEAAKNQVACHYKICFSSRQATCLGKQTPSC